MLSLSRPGALRGISTDGQGPGGGGGGELAAGGKGPGQIRIGNTGGSNPKREKRHQNKKIKKEKEKGVVATTLAGWQQPRL